MGEIKEERVTINGENKIVPYGVSHTIRITGLTTDVNQVKDAIELLKLPYIIRYDYKMKRYELIELPINMIDTSYELTEAQEKELAMIKIYNYLRQGVKINSNTLYRLYKWDDKTAREFIRNMAYNLYQVSHKEYIYFA